MLIDIFFFLGSLFQRHSADFFLPAPLSPSTSAPAHLRLHLGLCYCVAAVSELAATAPINCLCRLRRWSCVAEAATATGDSPPSPPFLRRSKLKALVVATPPSWLCRLKAKGFCPISFSPPPFYIISLLMLFLFGVLFVAVPGAATAGRRPLRAATQPRHTCDFHQLHRDIGDFAVINSEIETPS